MAVQKEVLAKNKLVLIPFPVTLYIDAFLQKSAIICGKISTNYGIFESRDINTAPEHVSGVM
jgi:hypothetical protein